MKFKHYAIIILVAVIAIGIIAVALANKKVYPPPTKEGEACCIACSAIFAEVQGLDKNQKCSIFSQGHANAVTQYTDYCIQYFKDRPKTTVSDCMEK